MRVRAGADPPPQAGGGTPHWGEMLSSSRWGPPQWPGAVGVGLFTSVGRGLTVAVGVTASLGRGVGVAVAGRGVAVGVVAAAGSTKQAIAARRRPARCRSYARRRVVA